MWLCMTYLTCPEFRHGDGKMLGTQPHPTRKSASTHYVPNPCPIKEFSNRLSKLSHTHTHTNMHLNTQHTISSSNPSIRLLWHSIVLSKGSKYIKVGTSSHNIKWFKAWHHSTKQACSSYSSINSFQTTRSNAYICEYAWLTSLTLLHHSTYAINACSCLCGPSYYSSSIKP